MRGKRQQARKDERSKALHHNPRRPRTQRHPTASKNSRALRENAWPEGTDRPRRFRPRAVHVLDRPGRARDARDLTIPFREISHVPEGPRSSNPTAIACTWRLHDVALLDRGGIDPWPGRAMRRTEHM